MKRFRIILILLAISLIVTISFKLTDILSTDVPALSVNLKHDTIDYSVDAFTLTTMDKTGNPQYHLTAEKMHHYQNSDITHVTTPSIEIYNAASGHWHIQATLGNITPRGKQVTLSGDVRITGKRPSSAGPITIKTASLTIEPERKIISTKDKISISSQGMNMQSKGMHADLNATTIELLSNVRGSYVPH